MANLFYIAVNHVMDLSGNKCDILEIPKAHTPGPFIIGGFQIHFACFCFWMTITIMIDSSIKHNHKFGFILQSSHVIEKRSKHSTDNQGKVGGDLQQNTHWKSGGCWVLLKALPSKRRYCTYRLQGCK